MQKESSQLPIPKEESNKTQEKAEVKTEKQQKQKPQKQKKGPPANKKDEPATPQLFAQVDMRVGQIKQCWKHPQSDKLYCQKIEVCKQVRQIASGLQQFVPIQQMKGNCLVMINLKPRPLAGFPSNGMVVCASNADHTSIEVLRPAGENSQRLVLEGYQQLFGEEKVAIINPKKKILERVLPLFKTDEEGFVIWDGIKVKCGGEYIKSSIKNGGVS